MFFMRVMMVDSNVEKVIHQENADYHKNLQKQNRIRFL